MTVDIKKCNINDDYFHFSNRKNINSILNNGLVPSIGAASQLIGDRPNVSVSQGVKGIMGVINSFIYKFYEELRVSQIPEEYKKYFHEISDFETDSRISKEIACKAMTRKLKDEVYFRVKLNERQIERAKIGGITGYDVNFPIKIDKSSLEIVTDSDNKVLTAYDVAKYVYERTKNVEVFRQMHEDFFYMFEQREQNTTREQKPDEEQR